MKNKSLPLIISILLAAMLAACAPAEPTAAPAPTSLAPEYLTSEYADATSLRNQLAYGTLKLDGTANAISAEQAKTLIPLWQAIISLNSDDTAVSEELTAVQDQIVTTLTPAQLQAIAAMQITNTELNAFYAEYDIFLPTPAPDVTKVPGSGGKTEAEKAAQQATAAASGEVPGSGSGAGKTAKTLLFEKTIEYLIGISK